MAYKLIAFDLDGTLLDKDKNIPAENLRALEAAASRGIETVVATGRIMEGIPEELKKLPYMRYYISINGAYVYDAKENKTLHRGEIPLETALQLCNYMDALPVLYDCYQDSRGWMTRSMYERAPEFFDKNSYVLDLVRRLRSPVESLPETLRQRGRPVQKLQMHFQPQHEKERLRQLELIPELFPELAATSSVTGNIELNSLSAGKGKALAALCRSLGIDPRDSVAFGDGSNDIEMLRAAGLGVAMDNADAQVKAAADAVTGTNNDAGVAQMIWKLLSTEN